MRKIDSADELKRINYICFKRTTVLEIKEDPAFVWLVPNGRDWLAAFFILRKHAYVKVD